MAKHKPTPEQLASIKALARQWGKIIAKNAYGEGGPGLDVDFEEMEPIAAATRRAARLGFDAVQVHSAHGDPVA